MGRRNSSDRHTGLNNLAYINIFNIHTPASPPTHAARTCARQQQHARNRPARRDAHRRQVAPRGRRRTPAHARALGGRDRGARARPLGDLQQVLAAAGGGGGGGGQRIGPEHHRYRALREAERPMRGRVNTTWHEALGPAWHLQHA